MIDGVIVVCYMVYIGLNPALCLLQGQILSQEAHVVPDVILSVKKES